jgi:hypothetical protein
MMLLLVALFGGLAGAVTLSAGVQTWIPLLLFGAAGLLVYGGAFVVRALVRGRAAQAADGLGAVFDRLHARELVQRERAEDLRSRWAEVQPRTKAAIESLGLLSFGRLDGEDAERLDRVIERDIPELRARLHRELAAAART